MRTTPSRGPASPVTPASRSATSRDIARIVALVVGDALSFLVFSALGRGTHHETTGFAAFTDVVLTAAPFALGWFLVAPFAGAYRRAKTAALTDMLGRTGLAWLASWPVALVLRWVFTSRFPPLSFALVALVANTLFLAIWRGAFVVVAGLWQRGRLARSAS